MEGNLFSTIISTITSLIGSITVSGGTTSGTGVLGWTMQFLDLITGNTVLLLFCIALPLVGLGIGVIRRLVRIRA